MSIYIDQSKIPTGTESHVKQNREYLLNTDVAKDFNTYFSFDMFPTFSDITSERRRYAAIKSLEGNNFEGRLNYQVGTWGARSLFNKFGAVIVGGLQDSANNVPRVLESSEIRLSHNAPLIDTPQNRQEMRDISRNCTIRDLVEDSKKGILGRATYTYADFMYCKHLGKMPNNYLVTLRRFPVPPDDYISNAGSRDTRLLKDPPSDNDGGKSKVSSSNAIAMGTMVTWMNTPGNNLEDILKYSVSMPYELKQAKWESDGIDADASDKPLNAISAMFDKTYRAQYAAGYAGGAVNKYINHFFPIADDGPYKNMLGFQDSNKVYGPVDAIKKVYYRGDQGIDFDQTFTLTFDYELRSYNGINGKAAMLDLLSNILNVTYTSGTFWGGGYTGGGAHQNNIFSNLNIMKCNGGFTDFMDAFAADASNIKASVRNEIQANSADGSSVSGIINMIKSFLNNLGGMLVGGMLNKLGRPQKSAVNSLLSPAPTGLWHVMIGNPYHPIMSLGNMVLKKTEISHYGPLGLDDFPTGLKVTCELERGKPRDLRGIEMIYLNGNDRIYTSMGPMVFDMYEKARNYNEEEPPQSKADIDARAAGAETEQVTVIRDGKETTQTVIHGTVITGNVGRSVDPNIANLTRQTGTVSGTRTSSIIADFNAYQSGNPIKKVFDYNAGIEKKNENGDGSGSSSSAGTATDGSINNYPSENDIKAVIEIDNKIKATLGVTGNVYYAYFGDYDPYAIVTGAREQEYGAYNKKEPSATSAGTAEGKKEGDNKK